MSKKPKFAYGEGVRLQKSLNTACGALWTLQKKCKAHYDKWGHGSDFLSLYEKNSQHLSSLKGTQLEWSNAEMNIDEYIDKVEATTKDVKAKWLSVDANEERWASSGDIEAKLLDIQQFVADKLMTSMRIVPSSSDNANGVDVPDQLRETTSSKTANTAKIVLSKGSQTQTEPQDQLRETKSPETANKARIKEVPSKGSKRQTKIAQPKACIEELNKKDACLQKVEAETDELKKTNLKLGRTVDSQTLEIKTKEEYVAKMDSLKHAPFNEAVRLEEENKQLKNELTNKDAYVQQLESETDKFKKSNLQLMQTNDTQRLEMKTKEEYVAKMESLKQVQSKEVARLEEENKQLKKELTKKDAYVQQIEADTENVKMSNVQLMLTNDTHRRKLQKIEEERLAAEKKKNEVLVVSCLLLNEPAMAAHFKTARDNFMMSVTTQLKEHKKVLRILQIPPSGDLPHDADNLQRPHVLVMPCLAVSRVSSCIDTLMSKAAAKAGHTLLFVVFHPRAPHDKIVASTVQQIGSLPHSCVQLVDVVFNRSNGGIFEGDSNETAIRSIADYLKARPAEQS